MSNTVNIDRPSEQEVTDLNSPQDLLEQLDGLVGSNGCIKSTQEIPKIISMMKEVTSLINKCLLLNVLQTTKANATLTRLMEDGGWNILNVWLLDAKKTGNTPLLIEIMQVLNKLPVTIASLKQGNLGKIVKQLTRHNSAEVKKVAGELLDKWMAIFREGQAARSSKDSVSSEGNSSEVAEESKPKKLKKLKKEKELKSPVELQPPLGPLVALGKPRDKLKRPRDLTLGKSGGSGEKKSKTLSPGGASVSTGEDEEDENEKTDKSQKGLTESSSFMNALSSQAAKWHEKRVKKIKAADRAKGLSKTSSSSDSGDSERLPSSNDTPSVSVDTPTEDQPMETSSSSVSLPQESDPQAMETDPVPTISSSKPKKRVSWAADEVLTSIQYFEIDESERVNRTRSFLDAAQKEKLMEREAMSSGMMFDQLMEMMQWYRPRQYADAISLIERGQLSEQRAIQTEREQKVLGQLFLSKASVAPTPVEPDPELEKNEIKPKLIPLLEPGAVEQPSIYQSTTPGGMPPRGPGPIHPPPAHVMGGPHPPPIMDPKMMVPPHGINMYPSQEHMVPPAHPMPNGPPNIRPNGPPPPAGPPMVMGGDQVGGGDWYGYNPSHGGGGRGYSPNYGGGNGEPFRGGPYRGRGRGRGQYHRFRNENGNHSNICKHFITHGCRLGNACKFLHTTPEELANNIHPSHKD